MKRSLSLPRVILFLAAIIGSILTPLQAADELEPIFSGKDLAGWRNGEANAFWQVADGMLVGENDADLNRNTLYTENSYRDFIHQNSSGLSIYEIRHLQ